MLKNVLLQLYKQTKFSCVRFVLDTVRSALMKALLLSELYRSYVVQMFMYISLIMMIILRREPKKKKFRIVKFETRSATWGGKTALKITLMLNLWPLMKCFSFKRFLFLFLRNFRNMVKKAKQH